MSYVEDCVLAFHEECVKLEEELVEAKMTQVILQDKIDRVTRLLEEEESEEAKKKSGEGIVDAYVSSVDLRKALNLPLRIKGKE